MDEINDSEENYTKPIYENGVYANPWKVGKLNILGFFKARICDRGNVGLPSNSKVLDQTLPVRNITESDLDNFYSDATNQIKFLWIGHASSLINIENCIVLMDPVFSNRCGPTGFLGPKRIRPVPITIDRLRKLDAVIISHNHYDHLDYSSVLKINQKFGKSVHWFVGNGIKSWFASCGITENVNEFTWWQSKEYKNIKFVFTLAQHSSKRGINDTNKTLWGSWCLIGPNKRFFFAGDTAYCPSFTEIGRKYGPFDLSAIPIGAYEPRHIVKQEHANPEDAVQIHLDVKSKKSIGVHWGTFILTIEHYLGPRTMLADVLKNLKMDEKCFVTLEHGEFYETNK